ncbi:MAG TPA: Gfo/Idh/MocA family oxidoreductase, partial [Actinomycetes bacterium]|nr:Gfo/Idh/MocA family oxidoreductase [Actinomycetes bacterium]
MAGVVVGCQGHDASQPGHRAQAHHGGRHEGRLAGHRLRPGPRPHLPRPSPGQRGGGLRPDLAKLQAFAEKFGYATTTEVASIYDDPAIELVDVCLPTALHAEHVTRAPQAGKHVLCELPLAATMADARRIADAQAASDRQVFVDMFGRFDPATEFLNAAIAEGRYGPLKTLAMELRSALLWEGYQIGLDSIAMDVMHGSLDTVATALGRPDSTIA